MTRKLGRVRFAVWGLGAVVGLALACTFLWANRRFLSLNGCAVAGIAIALWIAGIGLTKAAVGLFWRPTCPACGGERLEFHDRGGAERVKCRDCGFDDETGLSSPVS